MKEEEELTKQHDVIQRKLEEEREKVGEEEGRGGKRWVKEEEEERENVGEGGGGEGKGG